MIAKMSKVEIIGPKNLLQGNVSLLQESGIFQIEPDIAGFIVKADKENIKSFVADEKTLSERLYLENLKLQINELFSYLPDIPVRKSYIEPQSIIGAVEKAIQMHITLLKGLFQRKDALQKEISELNRYSVFLDTLSALLEETTEAQDLDFIGVALKDPGLIDYLRYLVSRITEGRFEILFAAAEDGTIVGLITVGKDISDSVRQTLGSENIPEISFPPAVGSLAFPQKVAYFKKRINEVSSEIKMINEEMERFSLRWAPIYKRVAEWIDDRLSLISATAFVFETQMCFLIGGWIPSKDVKGLKTKLKEAFSEEVILEEKEILEEDLERVPVLLKNPPYFKPFELFVRLLPLPRYSSFDPTPFIGIFFPLFFGMILGDAGYGFITIIASLYIMKRFRARKYICDASKIMLTCSIYTVFFGFIYGEFFGNLGHMLTGLKPLCIERRNAVMPMLYFAVSVGVVHVTIGLVLGFVSTLKRGAKREALYKLSNAIVLLCITALIAVLFDIFPDLLAKPVILAILILTPVLLFTGGLLAPLELLRNIGNVISYARIMAIGLASVLLAFMANRLGGMTGNIVTGILVAGLLHLLNIILGIFSPAIHSIRLHYVEFFTKFIEHGGRRFEPFKKTQGG